MCRTGPSCQSLLTTEPWIQWHPPTSEKLLLSCLKKKKIKLSKLAHTHLTFEDELSGLSSLIFFFFFWSNNTLLAKISSGKWISIFSRLLEKLPVLALTSVNVWDNVCFMGNIAWIILNTSYCRQFFSRNFILKIAPLAFLGLLHIWFTKLLMKNTLWKKYTSLRSCWDKKTTREVLHELFHTFLSPSLIL